MVRARSIAELRGTHPDPVVEDSLWLCPQVGDMGSPSQFLWILEMLEEPLGSLQLLPQQEIFFTLFQVTLLRGRRMRDAIINCDISPRGSMRRDATTVPPTWGTGMLGAIVSPTAVGPWQQSGVSWLHRGFCPLSDPAAPARAGSTEVPRSKGARRRRGRREADGGFDSSGSSAFHSLSRFNGRGDQSRDGVIHRDKPIPEEARRKQHCELCYPRHANRSLAPGGAAGSPGSVSRRWGSMGRIATP